MKHFWKLFWGLILVSFVILSGVTIWNSSVDPFPFDIDKKHSDLLFDTTREADQYTLEFLYKYPNTNYIVMHFQNHEKMKFLGGREATVYQRRIFWVDDTTGKRVLSVSYEDHDRNKIQQSWFYNFQRFTEPAFIRMDHDVLLHVNHYYSSGLNYGRKPSELAGLEKYTNDQGSNFYTFQPNGNLIDFKKPMYFYSIFGTDYFLQFHLQNEVIDLYQITDSETYFINSISSVRPSMLYEIGPDTFLSALTSSENTMQSTDCYILTPLEETTVYPTRFGEYVQTPYYQFQHLNPGRTDIPAVLTTKYPDYLFKLFEIEFDESFKNGTKKNIYTEIYEYRKYQPFTVMHQNQVLLLSDAHPDFTITMHQYDVIHRETSVYYTERLENNDGSLGVFDRDLQQFIVPNPISTVSVYPYDDDHLLMYGNNAIWTMKWDGTELKQIFPTM